MMLAQAFDQGADFDDLVGVEAHGGFVQDQHRRIADQRLGEAHPLFVALGQVFDQPAVHILDLHQTADFRDMFLAGELAFLQLIHEVQVFPHRHVQIQRRLLRQIADVGLGSVGILQHVVAVDLHHTLAGRQISGEYIHGGGFARAVGAEETQDLPLVHLEADILHRTVGAIPLREVLYLDHVDYHPFLPGIGDPAAQQDSGVRCRARAFILSDMPPAFVNSL